MRTSNSVANSGDDCDSVFIQNNPRCQIRDPGSARITQLLSLTQLGKGVQVGHELRGPTLLLIN